MSPNRAVTSLQCKCLKIIYNLLVFAVADEDAEVYKIIKHYLTTVTLHNLLKRMLRSQNLSADMRFNCLQLLVTDGVRELETGIFPRFYYTKVLKTITDFGIRLQHLDLRGVWVRDSPNLLSKLVKRLKGLKSLFIPHMANDKVIEAIVTLKYLNVLDISGESYFTASGIRNLKTESLQVLNIGLLHDCRIGQEEEHEETELEEEEDSDDEAKETEEEELDELEDDSGEDIISFQLVADLLENLPGLLALKTYSYTGNAMVWLQNKSPNYKTKLKYLHDTGTTENIIKSIVSLCPDLENIHLDEVEAGAIENLQQLEKLTTITLTKCNVQDIMSFLKVSGTELRILKLNNIARTPLDLSQVCGLAPNLRTLKFSQLKVISTNWNNCFKNLESIDLCYCDISNESIRFILKNSPLLKVLRITGSCVNMADRDVIKLCSDCKFESLEKLCFARAKFLTAASVQLFIENCPNLVEIGELDGWDVNKEEVLDLRTMVRCTNTDLTILPK